MVAGRIILGSYLILRSGKGPSHHKAHGAVLAQTSPISPPSNSTPQASDHWKGRAFFVKPRVLGSSDGGIAKARKRSWCIPMSVSLPNEVPSHRRNPIPRFPSVIWRTGAIDERGSPHMAVLSLVLIALGSGDPRRIPGQPLSLDRSRPPDYH